MSEWFASSQLSGLPGLPKTERAVRLQATRDAWRVRQSTNRTGRGRPGYEYHISSLPKVTQKHLITKSVRTQQQTTPEFAPTPQHVIDHYVRISLASTNEAREEAGRRYDAVMEVAEKLCLDYQKTDAYEEVAEKYGVTEKTIRRWMDTVKGLPGKVWRDALISSNLGKTVKADCSPEAWECFKADYLRPEKPALKPCYRRLQRVAKAKGWTIPGYDAMKRRMLEDVPVDVRIYLREGEEAASLLFPPQHRDKTIFRACEAVNGDGHTFDVFVRFPDGEITRPHGVFFQDIYSGKILSWNIEKTLTADSVQKAWADLLETYGIPSHCYLDNGREFGAKLLTGRSEGRKRFKDLPDDPLGLIPKFKTRVHWCNVYSGRSKPIERAFRDFCESISKHPLFAGAYTGNSPTNKPANYGSRAVPIEDFKRVLEQEIPLHNSQEKRRSDVCRGIHSFDDVFNASYDRSLMEFPEAEQVFSLRLPGKVVTVSKASKEITLFERNHYWSEALSKLAGQKVIAHYDPEDLHKGVYVYQLDGVFLGYAECSRQVGFNDAEVAAEYAKAKKGFTKATKQRAKNETRMKTLEAATLLSGVASDVGEDKEVTIVDVDAYYKKFAKEQEEAEESTCSMSWEDYEAGLKRGMAMIEIAESVM